jgi:hypothetical protein
MLKTINLLFTVLVIGTAAIAQKPFQGTITYKWTLVGEGAEMMQSMMPESTSMTFGKSGLRITFNGGMMAAMIGEFMYQAKSGKTYMLKADEQVAYYFNEEEEETPEPVFEKEDEIITIQGYSCQKYKMTSMSQGQPMVSYVWLSDKLKPYHLDKGGRAGISSGSAELGFALKVETLVEGMSIIMTVSDINATVPDKSTFKVPADFEEKLFEGL